MQQRSITTKIFVLLLFLSTNLPAQKPKARWLQQVTYDEANKQVLLFGGAGDHELLRELWCFKNNTWKKLADNGPSGTIKAAFAFDANRRCAVLFGGAGDGNKPLDETWEWNGQQWKKINIAGPPGRIHSMAAYDPKNKEIIIFGGFGDNGHLRDTWVYNGKSWIQKNADGPTNCIPHGIFYNEEKQKIILVTLSSTTDPNASHIKNEMWEWTGHSWKNLSYGTLSTATGNLQSMASYANGEIVFLDGDDTSGNKAKTWIFRDNKWTGVYFFNPSPRIGAGMVYDKSKHRTILVGGGNRKDVYSDVWEWDGESWKEMK